MVRKNIVFTQKAADDLRSIRYWYGEQQPGLGDKFFAEVLSILYKVEKNPAAYRFIKKGIRRCRPEKFPYYLYFSHSAGITVLSVRHVKQKPLKRFL